MSKRRVVITGMGAVTPVGLNVNDMWDSIKSGKHGIKPLTRFDTSDIPVKVAATVEDFDPLDYMDKKEVRRSDMFCQFAVAASKQALENAGSAPS